MHDTFLYLRTKRPLIDDEEAIERLRNAFPYEVRMSELGLRELDRDITPMPILFFGNDEVTWENGLVLRFSTYRPLTEIASLFEDSLSKFDAWTLFQRGVGFIERPDGGPLKDLIWLTKNIMGSQIYLMSYDSDYNLISIVEEIRFTLNMYVCDSIFSFKGGKILFVSTPEPSGTTAQRCARALQRFENWAIVDSFGDTRSGPGDGDVWRKHQLRYLDF